jgi:DNA polymerase
MSKEECWLILKEKALQCRACALGEERTRVVFGCGNLDAKVMLLGMNPGATEDSQGVPFVGIAGRRLNGLLEKALINRNHVYITNVCLCKSPRNREPTPEEVALCSEHLRGQMEIVAPKLVVTLGNFAGGALLGRPINITKEHGQTVDCEYKGWRGKVFLTFHPVAAIYSKKVRAWLEEDFKKLGGMVGMQAASGAIA